MFASELAQICFMTQFYLCLKMFISNFISVKKDNRKNS